jgi:hypothetical protein
VAVGQTQGFGEAQVLRVQRGTSALRWSSGLDSTLHVRVKRDNRGKAAWHP